MSTEDIRSYHKVNDQVITGGQPTEGQIRAAAKEGVQVLINLATTDPRYSLDDEAGLAQSVGLEYHHIPVVWEQPTPADFDVFVEVMRQTQDRRKLIHCAANYRVTAFYSLYAMQDLGWTAEQAAALRAVMWQRPYPVWEAFIQEMQNRIQADKP